MSLLAVYFLVRMVLRVNMGCSALDYRDNYRFPCGPEDCSESATCWNDSSKWPLLNSPTSETDLSSTFHGQLASGLLECETYGSDQGKTILQKRAYDQPNVDFNRTWDDYETGFGSKRNYWIGLKRIHRITSRARNILSIVLNNYTSYSESYHGFWVDDASNQYTMYAGPHKGHFLDPLRASKGRPFTAPDCRTTGCANMAESGWWFGRPCGRTNINLNGRHNSTGRDKIFVGIAIPAIIINVKTCQMAIRRTLLHCDKTCPNGGTCRKSSRPTGYAYVCDCQPRYTGRRCEVSLKDTTVATAHTTTVKAIPSTTVKAIPTTTTSGGNLSSRYITSAPTTTAPLDALSDVFLTYIFLPVFAVIVFLCAILAVIARKCAETKKKEINLNTGEETPLVRTTRSRPKRHKKRRRSKKLTKRNTV